VTAKIEFEGARGAVKALREIERSISPKLATGIVQGALHRAVKTEASPKVVQSVRVIKPDFRGKPIVSTGKKVPPKFRDNRDTSDSAEAAVYMFGVDARLIHLMEFGTSGHKIASKGKKILSNAFTAMGKHPIAFFGSVVNHPGARPTPTMEPAFNASHEGVKREFFIAMERRLRRVAKQLNGTYGKIKPSLKRFL
jgi:hypothetical protein